MSITLRSDLPKIFSSSVANGSWRTPLGSVPDLYQGIIDQLESAISIVAQDRLPRALTLLGEPGTGKTHLISQYRTKVLTQGERISNC